jgi:hypothetical protein
MYSLTASLEMTVIPSDAAISVAHGSALALTQSRLKVIS